MSLLQIEIGVALLVAFLAGTVCFWLFSRPVRRNSGRSGTPSRLGALGALLAFLLLYVYCISNDSVSIEASVREQAESSIQAAPIGGVSVAADGRSITLAGLVASEELKVKASALALAGDGVRSVDNQLVVGSAGQAVQAIINKILLERKIEFEAGRGVLLPQSVPVLEEVLKALSQSPQLSIRIEGHTDSVGSADANRALSKARAEAVEAWLSDHGFARNRMTALGFGPDKPIAPNTTPEGRSRNRRVEIITN